jgi:periplasmic mercuric ion binding protein
LYLLNTSHRSTIYLTMKSYLALTVLLALGVVAQAAETVRLSNVHLCCNACVKGVEKAVAGVKNLTTVVDKDGGTVVLQAEDSAAAQKGVDALVKAGYFGASDHKSIQPKADTGAPAGKVKSLKVEGVHLCCGSCVKAVNGAITKVKGVQAHTAVKNAKTFEITGDFLPADVFAALHKAGLTGKTGN